ncbi:MAG: hypothetical protein ACRD3O_23505, partial [Terriglobia bacterium]
MGERAHNPEQESGRGSWKAWTERLQALRNLPPLVKLMWQAGPSSVVMGTAARILTGIVPLATLDIGRII